MWGESTLHPLKIVIIEREILHLVFLNTCGHHILHYFCSFQVYCINIYAIIHVHMHDKLFFWEKTITLKKRKFFYRWALYYFFIFFGLVMCHEPQT